MATVTEPIMTDATGQSIDSKLNSLLGKMDNLAAAFQPNASGIVYSNTTSGLTGDDVQEAIDEMAADVSEINQSLLQYWSTSATPTVPAGTSGDLEFAIPAAYQSGYRVASYAIYSGSKVVKPYVFEITSTKITYYVENTSGSSIARQITIKVLFQKV